MQIISICECVDLHHTLYQFNFASYYLILGISVALFIA